MFAGATLDGLWPYTYDSCDVGTLPNQTFPDGTPAANVDGNPSGEGNNGALSYLAGQRLSSWYEHPLPRASNRRELIVTLWIVRATHPVPLILDLGRAMAHT